MPLRLGPLLATLLAGGLGGGLPVSGQSIGPERPELPAARVETFDSDPGACQPDMIRAAYKSHLLPFADQSPAVLAQLRRVQDDLTLASLKRCVQKGLLTRPQASVLFRELGLTLPGTAIPTGGARVPGASQPASAASPPAGGPSPAATPPATAP